MILSSAQLTTLRSQPNETRLFLSIYRPATLLACQVNDPTITRGSRSITYDGVSAGSYLSVEADVTLMVGTSAGQDDVGRIRVRSITSSVITVAENTLSWADNHYLTIIQQVDINAVFPRIINNPSDPTSVIFYKDFDISYTNQNTVLGSFPNMGSHRAAFRDGGNASLYYTATGTYNVNGDSLTYLWNFEGGTPTGSTALTPGYVSYPTSGHYRTKLTVSNASGGSDISYRYVSIYDRPENGTSVPILKWQLKQFSGSRSEGGYTLGITVKENMDQIQPNALVVIFADDLYGGTQVSLGGNQQNSEKIVFVGYILADTIVYDYQKSEVNFSAGSVSEVMKIAEGFSCSVETKASPATWFEIQDMSIAKAMYHYLRWHSTVLKVTDVQYTGDDRKVQFFDADRSSLYDAIAQFLSSGVLGQLVSDRQGKLWAEILPEGRVNPLDPPVAMSLLKQDWIGSPSLTEKRTEQTSFVEMGGIAWSGVSTGTFSALLTNAPDTAPLYRGRVEKKQGFILLNQGQLNSMSGNYLATKNARFPEISFNLAGNYRNLDIAPVESVRPFIAVEDTIRGIRIFNDPYRVESMSWAYDPVHASFTPDIVVHRISTGSAGTTVEIPDVPDDGGFGQSSGFNLPRIPALGLPAQFAEAIQSTAFRAICLPGTLHAITGGRAQFGTPIKVNADGTFVAGSDSLTCVLNGAYLFLWDSSVAINTSTVNDDGYYYTFLNLPGTWTAFGGKLDGYAYVVPGNTSANHADIVGWALARGSGLVTLQIAENTNASGPTGFGSLFAMRLGD